MPRNGSGVLSLPATYLAVSGETIQAQQHNDPLEDLEADANNARPIVAGGTGASSAADARTNLGVLSSSEVAANIAALLPSGTRLLFQQTAAPTGWTKDTTHDNKALRLVNGSVTAGGSTAFTTVFGARTIAQTNLPNVTLSVSGTFSGAGTNFNPLNSSGVGAPADAGPGASGNPASLTVAGSISGTTSALGSGTAMDFAVQYVDVIVAVKD